MTDQMAGTERVGGTGEVTVLSLMAVAETGPTIAMKTTMCCYMSRGVRSSGIGHRPACLGHTAVSCQYNYTVVVNTPEYIPSPSSPCMADTLLWSSCVVSFAYGLSAGSAHQARRRGSFPSCRRHGRTHLTTDAVIRDRRYSIHIFHVRTPPFMHLVMSLSTNRGVPCLPEVLIRGDSTLVYLFRLSFSPR
jgi:hypothetical protein